MSDEETSSQTLARGRLTGNGGENNKKISVSALCVLTKAHKVSLHSFGFTPAERTERIVRGC